MLLAIQLALSARGSLLETVCYPHFDDGLPGNAEPRSLSVECLNHPHWKIDIYPADLTVWAAGTREIQIGRYVNLATIEGFIKVLGLHRF